MGFNALTAIKFGVSAIVGMGTGKIVAKVIKEHAPMDTLIDKVTVTAAAWAISGMAVTATKKYTNETIDQTAETIATVVEKVKTNAKLSRINRNESTFEAEGLDETLFVKEADGMWHTKIDNMCRPKTDN